MSGHEKITLDHTNLPEGFFDSCEEEYKLEEVDNPATDIERILEPCHTCEHWIKNRS